MKLVFLLLVLISCSSRSDVKQISGQKEDLKVENAPFEYEVKDIDLYNGKIKYVSLATDAEDGSYAIECGDKKRMGFVEDNKLHIYLSESYFSKPHSKKCFFKKHHILNVSVKKFKYKQEKLNVPKRKVDLNKKDLARVIREKEIKKGIYKKSAPNYYFTQPFKIPLNSKITSYYGNQRLFNNKKRSQHLGNDLRAAVGLPVPATNRGRIVFTGDLFFSGGIVVIDHGLELFTVYMHLSKILVEKGMMVNQGDIVGKAGMTGRVSGPHLHWGVRQAGSWIDGFNLVKASQVHFSDDKLEK